MGKITIDIEDGIIFEKMLIAIRDSAELQDYTDVSYLESIKKLNEIRKKLGR